MGCLISLVALVILTKQAGYNVEGSYAMQQGVHTQALIPGSRQMRQTL
jgi:hypothetical protein